MLENGKKSVFYPAKSKTLGTAEKIYWMCRCAVDLIKAPGCISAAGKVSSADTSFRTERRKVRTTASLRQDSWVDLIHTIRGPLGKETGCHCPTFHGTNFKVTSIWKVSIDYVQSALELASL
jgi:hypothetical protein